MKNKKGFTLVELLAVIAIIAMLIVVAVPNVIDLFIENKKSVFLTQAKTIYKECTTKYITESLKGNTLYEIDSEVNKLDISDTDVSYRITLDGNGRVTSIVVSNDEYCVSGGKDFLQVSKVSDVLETSCNLNSKEYGESITFIAGSTTFFLKNKVAYVNGNDIEINKINVPDKENFSGYYYKNKEGNEIQVVTKNGTLVDYNKLKIDTISNVIKLIEKYEDINNLVPTCTLKINGTKVEFDNMSDYVTSYGMNTTSNPEYNNVKNMNIGTTTFHGYVKSESGKTGSCSITIDNTKSVIVKTTNTCQKKYDCSISATTYYNIEKINYTCSSSKIRNYKCTINAKENKCSSITDEVNCKKYSSCTWDSDQLSCKGSYYSCDEGLSLEGNKCYKINDVILNNYTCSENELEYQWDKGTVVKYISKNECGSIKNPTCNKNETTTECRVTGNSYYCDNGGEIKNNRCYVYSISRCPNNWVVSNTHYEFSTKTEVVSSYNTSTSFTCNDKNLNKSYYTSKEEIGCNGENYIKYNDKYCYKLGA